MSKKNDLIEKFVNEGLTGYFDDLVTITNKYNEFSANVDACMICVPKWKGYKFDKKNLADKQFEQFFHSLSNYAKDFSLVTLSILHEMGHFATDEKIPLKYDRYQELVRIHKEAKSKKELNNLYFQMRDEKMATLWAVKWLANKENRHLAKEFEVSFFARKT